MGYWPEDIRKDDIRTPEQILAQAARELEEKVPTLKVRIRETSLEDRVVLSFIVKNAATETEIILFEVAHQKNQPYPLAIDPPFEEIPDFLRKRQFQPGIDTRTGASTASAKAGRWLENEWVCGSPAEFDAKLKDLLSREAIKGRLFNLLLVPEVSAMAEGSSDDTFSGRSDAGD